MSDLLRVLLIDERLPNLPFRSSRAHVDVCQFSLAIEGGFGPVLQALADFHGDSSVTVGIFEPSPSYYRESYGSYPCFKLSSGLLLDEYWAAVSYEPGGDPTGAVTYTANVVGIAGSSGAWAVWAERSWDLALVFSDTADGPWVSAGIQFVPAETALESFTEPDFKVPLPAASRARFLQNISAHRFEDPM